MAAVSALTPLARHSSRPLRMPHALRHPYGSPLTSPGLGLQEVQGMASCKAGSCSEVSAVGPLIRTVRTGQCGPRTVRPPDSAAPGQVASRRANRTRTSLTGPYLAILVSVGVLYFSRSN